MSVELFREKPIFEATLDLCIQAGAHTDAKNTALVFRILEGTRQQPSSNQTEKIFHFELTDSSEPFFLYILDIGEYDFHNLKRDQSIIVDFLAFPAKLVALLKTCMGGQGGGQGSRFSTALDPNSGLFSVVESNEFKNLTHISLQLRPANDAALKAYLAARLSMSLEDAAQLRQRLEDAGDCNQEATHTIAGLNDAISALRARLDHEVITLQAAHSNEVSSLRVAHTEAANALKAESEGALAALRAQSEKTISELRTEVEYLKGQCSGLEKQLSDSEYRTRELERDLGMVTTERNRADASSKQYSSALAERDATILTLEREAAALKSKIESCRQQLADKEEVIGHAVGERQAAEAARNEAIERTELYSSAVEAMQEKLLVATAEMNRGNQMIKLQLKEIDDLREKIRIKNEVLRKQEAVVGDGRAQIADLNSRLQNEIKAKETEQQRVEMLTREVESGREKVAAGVETIERNKEIMNHLNEMITALQMGGGGSTSSPSWTTPPGAAASKNAGRGSQSNKSYGFRVVSGQTFDSPDGMGGLYDALSPPTDNQGSKNGQPAKAPAGGNTETGSGYENSTKWSSNKAVMDSFSTRKYDTLIPSYPGDVTPASTSSSKKGVETDGYYRGLPVGSNSLTPSVTGEANVYLHSAASATHTATSSASKEARKAQKYHWQADDFGLDDVVS